MKRLEIQKVSSIDFVYPYLEVFLDGATNPSVDIGINEQKGLDFKFYKASEDVVFSLAELEYIIGKAKDFLPKAIKDEEDFQAWHKAQTD